MFQSLFLCFINKIFSIFHKIIITISDEIFSFLLNPFALWCFISSTIRGIRIFRLNCGLQSLMMLDMKQHRWCLRWSTIKLYTTSIFFRWCLRWSIIKLYTSSIFFRWCLRWSTIKLYTSFIFKVKIEFITIYASCYRHILYILFIIIKILINKNKASLRTRSKTRNFKCLAWIFCKIPYRDCYW